MPPARWAPGSSGYRIIYWRTGSLSEMGAVPAFRDGIRRVNAAPLVLAGMVLATLLTALPHARAFAELPQAVPAARALPLGNLGALIDAAPMTASLAGVTMTWLVVWSFLSGGVLDRYARQRATRAYGFFGACGTHFWRFLRLGVAVGAVYLVMFGPVHAGLFGMAAAAQAGPAGHFAASLVFVAGLAAFSLIFDYARVRIVVEDRRSAIGALVAACRFLGRHAGAVLALFLLNACAWLALVMLWTALSAGSNRADMEAWLVLTLGQAYIIGRHYLKLLVYASAVALFQGRLAHAAWTAAPALVWPESPAVESITNAEPMSGR